MVSAGHVYANRPSIRALARAAGVPSSETVRQMIYGESIPESDTVDAVAGALRRSAIEVAGWVNQARAENKGWTPPVDSALLNSDERQALDRLIRLMVADRKPKRWPRGGQVLEFPDIDVFDEKAADERRERIGADTTDKDDTP